MIWRIDHTLLSPSGRVSKRARRAAQERIHADIARTDPELANVLSMKTKLPPQPSRQTVLRQQAARLRDFASRGMKPRAYPKEAARLEAEADALDAAEACK